MPVKRRHPRKTHRRRVSTRRVSTRRRAPVRRASSRRRPTVSERHRRVQQFQLAGRANLMYQPKIIQEGGYMTRYGAAERLGGGAYGTVYNVKRKPDIVAKVMKNNPKEPNAFLDEVTAMRAVKGQCDYPIEILGTGKWKNNNYYAMNRAPPGYKPLEDLFKQYNACSLDTALLILNKVNEKMICFYKQTGYIHGDAHQGNVWYNPTTKDVMLMDWGLWCNKEKEGMRGPLLARGGRVGKCLTWALRQQWFLLKALERATKRALTMNVAVQYLTWPLDTGLVDENEWKRLMLDMATKSDIPNIW